MLQPSKIVYTSPSVPLCISASKTSFQRLASQTEEENSITALVQCDDMATAAVVGPPSIVSEPLVSDKSNSSSQAVIQLSIHLGALLQQLDAFLTRHSHDTIGITPDKSQKNMEDVNGISSNERSNRANNTSQKNHQPVVMMDSEEDWKESFTVAGALHNDNSTLTVGDPSLFLTSGPNNNNSTASTAFDASVRRGNPNLLACIANIMRDLNNNGDEQSLGSALIPSMKLSCSALLPHKRMPSDDRPSLLSTPKNAVVIPQVPTAELRHDSFHPTRSQVSPLLDVAQQFGGIGPQGIPDYYSRQSSQLTVGIDSASPLGMRKQVSHALSLRTPRGCDVSSGSTPPEDTERISLMQRRASTNSGVTGGGGGALEHLFNAAEVMMEDIAQLQQRVAQLKATVLSSAAADPHLRLLASALPGSAALRLREGGGQQPPPPLSGFPSPVYHESVSPVAVATSVATLKPLMSQNNFTTSHADCNGSSYAPPVSILRPEPLPQPEFSSRDIGHVIHDRWIVVDQLSSHPSVDDSRVNRCWRDFSASSTVQSLLFTQIMGAFQLVLGSDSDNDSVAIADTPSYFARKVYDKKFKCCVALCGLRVDDALFAHPPLSVVPHALLSQEYVDVGSGDGLCAIVVSPNLQALSGSILLTTVQEWMMMAPAVAVDTDERQDAVQAPPMRQKQLLEVVARICITVAEALIKVHGTEPLSGSRLCHGAITPDNIFITFPRESVGCGGGEHVDVWLGLPRFVCRGDNYDCSECGVALDIAQYEALVLRLVTFLQRSGTAARSPTPPTSCKSPHPPGGGCESACKVAVQTMAKETTLTYFRRVYGGCPTATNNGTVDSRRDEADTFSCDLALNKIMGAMRALQVGVTDPLAPFRSLASVFEDILNQLA